MTWENMSELREKLDKNGIAWSGDYDDNGDTTAWKSPRGQLFNCGHERLNHDLYLHVSPVTANQAIAATLGGGTLTAEQVREVIFGNSYYAAYASSQYYAIGIDMQAIADELNAMLGSGECEMYRDEYGVWHCSSCEKGADKTTGNDGVLDSWNNSWPPNFCPYCGAKVKAVRR